MKTTLTRGLIGLTLLLTWASPTLAVNGDPDPFGTAQGYWDLGGTNALRPSPGSVLLTVPNVVSATATRYLWMQATVWIASEH